MGAALAAAAATAGRSGEARDEKGTGAWMTALVAAVGTLALFFLTRKSEPPFSLGERLGYGILIGGALGAAAGVWAARARPVGPWRSTVCAAGLPSLALFGAGLTVLIFRDYPQPALGGFMIGALGTAVLYRLAVRGSDRVDIWALSASALGAAVLLAAMRYDTVDGRVWWRAPLIVAVAVVVAQLASAGTIRPGRRLALPAVAASAIVLILTAVFAWKVFPNWAFFWVSAMGVATFALVAWLGSSAPGAAPAAAAQALVVIAFATVAFRLMAGFGIGIGLLAAWAVLLPALASTWRTEPREEEQPTLSRTLVYAMFIGVGLLLLRLFLETYALEVRGLDLRAHYTLIALSVGAVLPFVLGSFFPPSAFRWALWRAIAAGAAGLFAAAVPLVILIIWGFKAELGFLIGTIAAGIFVLLIHTGAVGVKGRAYTESAVLVTAAQISAVQLSGLLAPASESPRLARVVVLAVVVVAGLLWAGITALAARRGAKEAA